MYIHAKDKYHHYLQVFDAQTLKEIPFCIEANDNTEEYVIFDVEFLPNNKFIYKKRKNSKGDDELVILKKKGSLLIILPYQHRDRFSEIVSYYGLNPHESVKLAEAEKMLELKRILPAHWLIDTFRVIFCDIDKYRIEIDCKFGQWFLTVCNGYRNVFSKYGLEWPAFLEMIKPILEKFKEKDLGYFWDRDYKAEFINE